VWWLGRKVRSILDMWPSHRCTFISSFFPEPFLQRLAHNQVVKILRKYRNWGCSNTKMWGALCTGWYNRLSQMLIQYVKLFKILNR
jgi:hypothetical protein